MLKKIILLFLFTAFVPFLTGCFGKEIIAGNQDAGVVALKQDEMSENRIPGNPDIIVAAPESGGIVKSPIVVQGKAKGTWYFEAGFPVFMFDENGNQIAAATASAQGEWMTENFVPFSVELRFNADKKMNGTLVLKKDNPSGLPQNEDELRIPVAISN
jgi:hypothetical protein